MSPPSLKSRPSCWIDRHPDRPGARPAASVHRMTEVPRVGREQTVVVLRNRVALFLSAVFQPPVTVAALLMLSPVIEPGFPGTIWFGALAVLFVCVLPFAAVLLLVR